MNIAFLLVCFAVDGENSVKEKIKVELFARGIFANEISCPVCADGFFAYVTFINYSRLSGFGNFVYWLVDGIPRVM